MRSGDLKVTVSLENVTFEYIYSFVRRPIHCSLDVIWQTPDVSSDSVWTIYICPIFKRVEARTLQNNMCHFLVTYLSD